MFARTAILGAVLSLSTSAMAAITSVDLSTYQLTATYNLPLPAAAEASAVTWNWDNGNMFVLGDEGETLVEVTRAGATVSTMSLSGFGDTEGLTYIGNGQFVIAEERLQDVFLLTYVAGGSVNRGTLQSVSLGPTIGNIGLEGISYEPGTGDFFVVKEKDPQAVYQASLNFAAGTGTVTGLFTPALGVADLSDIQVLSTVASLQGTADQDNLLIFSQEASKLLEVSRTGQVLSEFDLSAITGNAEGVTIDSNGVIYIVAEEYIGGSTPQLYVLTPAVPEPETYALMIAGLGAIAAVARRRRSKR